MSTELAIKDDNEALVDDDALSLREFLAFKVGDAQFSVDIKQVKEIRAWSETTPLPNTPSFVRGVINLRGIIVPIFDVKDRLGRGHTAATATHVMIILWVGGRTIGLLVDEVSDILNVAPGEIRGTPRTQDKKAPGYVVGLIGEGERLTAVIDADSMFSRDVVNASRYDGATEAESEDVGADEVDQAW